MQLATLFRKQVLATYISLPLPPPKLGGLENNDNYADMIKVHLFLTLKKKNTQNAQANMKSDEPGGGRFETSTFMVPLIGAHWMVEISSVQCIANVSL